MVVSFGEDPEQVGCEQFFGEIVEEFLTLFAKAHHQNERARQMEEKLVKRAEAARKKLEAKEARKKVGWRVYGPVFVS